MITLIAAADLDRVIGQGNALPWHLPADLQRFKRATMGRAIVMGRRTFHAIKRPLPGRLNVVLSRDPAFSAEGIVVARNLDDALMLGAHHHDEVMVIGGAAVYAEALPRCHRMLLTIVQGRFSGDAWLPMFPAGEWVEKERVHFMADEANRFAATCYELVRSSPTTAACAPFIWPT